MPKVRSEGLSTRLGNLSMDEAILSFGHRGRIMRVADVYDDLTWELEDLEQGGLSSRISQEEVVYVPDYVRDYSLELDNAIDDGSKNLTEYIISSPEGAQINMLLLQSRLHKFFKEIRSGFIDMCVYLHLCRRLNMTAPVLCLRRYLFAITQPALMKHFFDNPPKHVFNIVDMTPVHPMC